MTIQEQLTEYSIQDIIDYIVTEDGIEYDLAMQKFFSSETFEKLMDTQTELYRESSAYIYSLYCDEVQNGRFIQNEI
ncbi:MAG: hypothetical protein Q4D76_14550 [Oscillospiraceae bacterium]|nr:hypothetical protein [Oscillospiraceae bacterium]